MGGRRRDLGVRRSVVRRRKAINERCLSYGFSYPTLFGSTARGDRTFHSDVDILVWTRGNDPGAADRAEALAGELTTLLHEDVDISIGEWVRPCVADRAVRTGTVLFRRSGPWLRLRRWMNRGDTERFDEEEVTKP